MNEILSLKPEAVWRHFHSLTQVPRPSGHLEKVQQFLLDFGAQIGVETFKDEAGNIIMRKPATSGMENRKGIILQAHMDMVPQKSKSSSHNFETDPIETWVDGEWLKAKDTTLGADDGIGVAAIMAIMEDNNLKHGPIEGLITADEETGMYGANGLPEGLLHGDIMLNLDSETWGQFCIGSAGGVNFTATLGYKEVATDAEDAAVRVVLKGLKGGHSGLEIHLGRGNANKLMARFVHKAIADIDARLASWHGGNMRNAIPFECEVLLTLPKENVDAIKEAAQEYASLLADEYAGIESGIQFFAEDAPAPAMELPEEIQDNLLDAIYGCHNGVLRMIPSFPTVVETSSNLAIVDIADGQARIKILVRGSRESYKHYLAETLASTFNMAGMKMEFDGDYCGWDPNTQSETLHVLLQKYKELFGEEGTVVVDHAGLECSIILGKYPDLDVVSFGPTLRSPHTTSERCLIASVAPFYELIVATLADAPVKA